MRTGIDRAASLRGHAGPCVRRCVHRDAACGVSEPPPQVSGRARFNPFFVFLSPTDITAPTITVSKLTGASGVLVLQGQNYIYTVERGATPSDLSVSAFDAVSGVFPVQFVDGSSPSQIKDINTGARSPSTGICCARCRPTFRPLPPRRKASRSLASAFTITPSPPLSHRRRWNDARAAVRNGRLEQYQSDLP